MLDKFRNKRILIWGYGREGKSTETFFKNHPVAASVDISEAKPDEIDLSGYDFVFKSPGIRLEYPTLEGFEKANNPIIDRITSQTEFFIESFRDKVIGITGTKGKSTTTSLLYHVLKSHREHTYLVGNIGVPCLDYYDQMMEDDAIAVFELSCHQLAYSRVSPHIGIFLNLYEDHLDFYGDRATYGQAKSHITGFQEEGDFLYVGTDVPDLDSKAEIIRVTGRYDDDDMVLLGDHNKYNAKFVDSVARERFGLDPMSVKNAIDAFPGLCHRLQFVTEKNGVRYYDDSISTIPEATIQALTSVPNVQTVLIGGMDREIDYTPLKEYILKNNDINYILMYASGKRIYDELSELMEGGLSGDVDCEAVRSSLHVVADLEEAVALSGKVTPDGAACVLSPAAASYGYFKNFEERGDVYAGLI